MTKVYNGFEYIIKYSIEEAKEVILTKYIGKDKNVIIPSEIEGYPVTRIEDYLCNYFYDEYKTSIFMGNDFIETVTFPNTITYIPQLCFDSCRNLKNVIISSSITEIRDGVFSNCNSLKNIIIPKSVTYLGSYLFNGCINLKSVAIENPNINLNPDTFNGCTNLTINSPINSTVEKYIQNYNITFESD